MLDVVYVVIYTHYLLYIVMFIHCLAHLAVTHSLASWPTDIHIP